jgi:hypothetical protein
MFIPDPDFYPSWISDPTIAAKKEGKKIVVPPFFEAQNFTKLRIILVLNR